MIHTTFITEFCPDLERTPYNLKSKGLTRTKRKMQF